MANFMIDNLHENGFALGSADSLIPSDLLSELETTVAAIPPRPISPLKPYLVHMLGRWPTYDPQSVYAKIATHLEPIAQAYLHKPPVLFFYNVWHSLVCPNPPSQSQLWHRDYDDVSLLKAFYYLTDVTEDAGPLHYIPGTHWRGKRQVDPVIHKEKFASVWVDRVTDEAMAAVVPPSDYTVATGPKGTLVLADTTGWHKGGFCTGRERLVATWEWVTTDSPHRVRFAAQNPWEAA